MENKNKSLPLDLPEFDIESKSKLTFQTVEKIIEVPVESVKIVTVERIVEVPIEVIKYVDRIVEPNKENELQERKFQYQLQ